MLNVLCILVNNLKYEHNCKYEQQYLTQIHFGFVLITNTTGNMWSIVENNLPCTMIRVITLGCNITSCLS